MDKNKQQGNAVMALKLETQLESVKEPCLRRAKKAALENHKMTEDQVKNLIRNAPTSTISKMRDSKTKMMKSDSQRMQSELKNANMKYSQLRDWCDTITDFEKQLDGIANQIENDLSRIVKKEEQNLTQQLKSFKPR